MTEQIKSENENTSHDTADAQESGQPSGEKDHVLNNPEPDFQDGPEPTAEKDALTELQEKYAMLNDKYLRLYSEFENFRRRTAKEKIDSLRNAGSDILKDFLPVVDDFDRAILANEQNIDIENIKEGFKLIHHKLLRVLESRGVKPMDSFENPFDTNFHEAITNIPAPKENLKGKVVDVAEKGYFFHDAVLRYAKVVVGQ